MQMETLYGEHFKNLMPHEISQTQTLLILIYHDITENQVKILHQISLHHLLLMAIYKWWINTQGILNMKKMYMNYIWLSLHDVHLEQKV